MSHRSPYASSLRTRPPRNYNEEDDDDDFENDVVDLHNTDYANYHRVVEPNYRHPKKRRIDSYDPDSPPLWSDHATAVLLELWGDKFLQLGRSSLRGEDWSEVAERVSDMTGFEFSVTDCRNKMNALKNKYKREKMKLQAMGGGSSKWPYFKKMDMLMTMSPRQEQQQLQCGLACGVDSGEFVFMNPRVYLDCSNALDEMRDSPGNSESEGDGNEEESEDEDDEESYRMLSDSIKKVGEIYERIENSKRQHMMELERMRMEFQRELELQKKEIVERTRAEMAKMREDGDDEGEDSRSSAENFSV